MAPSIEEVARRAGVSPITVSRVVRNHPNVRAETRQRVQQAVNDLHYVPNAVARGLKQARSGLIALIITDMVDPFFSVVAHGVEDAVRKAGMMLVLGNSGDELALETEYLRIMGEHRVNGIILVPTPRPPDVSLPMLPQSIPLVILDRALPGVEADVVRCDTASGTRALCQHLLQLGRRRIAIAGGLPHSVTWQERIAGYQKALRDAGLAMPETFVISGNYKAESGVSAVRELMARAERPDAIIAANAKVVRGVLDELVALGYRVPEDVAVGVIDNPAAAIAVLAADDLVEQPGYEMGKVAVELLLPRIGASRPGEPPKEIVFASTLNPGVTCGEALETVPRNDYPASTPALGAT